MAPGEIDMAGKAVGIEGMWVWPPGERDIGGKAIGAGEGVCGTLVSRTQQEAVGFSPGELGMRGFVTHAHLQKLAGILFSLPPTTAIGIVVCFPFLFCSSPPSTPIAEPAPNPTTPYTGHMYNYMY